MMASWHTGNAANDGQHTRGWILGHFIDSSEGIRSTREVEVKWATHLAGEKRAKWTKDEHRTTMVLLIEGNFHVHLTTGQAQLTQQGDYVVWGPGINHSWEAEENSIVVTLRWPSSVTS